MGHYEYEIELFFQPEARMQFSIIEQNPKRGGMAAKLTSRRWIPSAQTNTLHI